jgi:hypothetical protein
MSLGFGGIILDIRRTAGDPDAAKRLAAAMRPEVLHRAVAASSLELFRGHLIQLNTERPNQLGGKRTSFYADAARNTHAAVLPDGVLLSILKEGIRQRWLGGTIKAKPGSWLTIPARAEAYGRRARSFNDLRFVLLTGDESGGAALVRNETTTLKRKKDRKTGKVSYVAGEERGGEVMYWLRKSVTQRPDPTVIPLPDVIYGRLFADVGAFLDRRIAGPAKPGGPSAPAP